MGHRWLRRGRGWVGPLIAGSDVSPGSDTLRSSRAVVDLRVQRLAQEAIPRVVCEATSSGLGWVTRCIGALGVGRRGSALGLLWSFVEVALVVVLAASVWIASADGGCCIALSVVLAVGGWCVAGRLRWRRRRARGVVGWWLFSLGMLLSLAVLPLRVDASGVLALSGGGVPSSVVNSTVALGMLAKVAAKSLEVKFWLCGDARRVEEGGGATGGCDELEARRDTAEDHSADDGDADLVCDGRKFLDDQCTDEGGGGGDEALEAKENTYDTEDDYTSDDGDADRDRPWPAQLWHDLMQCRLERVGDVEHVRRVAIHDAERLRGRCLELGSASAPGSVPANGSKSFGVELWDELQCSGSKSPLTPQRRRRSARFAPPEPGTARGYLEDDDFGWERTSGDGCDARTVELYRGRAGLVGRLPGGNSLLHAARNALQQHENVHVGVSSCCAVQQRGTVDFSGETQTAVALLKAAGCSEVKAFHANDVWPALGAEGGYLVGRASKHTQWHWTGVRIARGRGGCGEAGRCHADVMESAPTMSPLGQLKDRVRRHALGAQVAGTLGSRWLVVRVGIVQLQRACQHSSAARQCVVVQFTDPPAARARADHAGQLRALRPRVRASEGSGSASCDAAGSVGVELGCDSALDSMVESGSDSESDAGFEDDTGVEDVPRARVRRPFLPTTPLAGVSVPLRPKERLTSARRENIARAIGIPEDAARGIGLRRVHQRLAEKHPGLYLKLCSTPLPTKWEYETHPSLRPPGFSGADDSEARRAAGRVLYAKDYARRRFQTECRTLEWHTCACCGRKGVGGGVHEPEILRASGSKGGGMWGRARGSQAKLVVRYAGPELESLRAAQGRRVHDGDLLLLPAAVAATLCGRRPVRWSVVPDVTCGKCVGDMSPYRKRGRSEARPATQPSFGPSGGFGHGVPLPACLVGLSHAEVALISPIQSAFCFTQLERGHRAAKGHAVFLNRISDAVEVARRLPRLPAEIEHVLLVREADDAKGGGDVNTMYTVRRLKVQAALEWLIANAPAFQEYGITLDEAALASLPDDAVPPAFVVLATEVSELPVTVTSAHDSRCEGRYVVREGVYENAHGATIAVDKKKQVGGKYLWVLRPPPGENGRPSEAVFEASSRSLDAPPTGSHLWKVTQHLHAAAGAVAAGACPVASPKYELSFKSSEPPVAHAAAGDCDDGPTAGMRQPEDMAAGDVDVQLSGTVTSSVDTSDALRYGARALRAVLGERLARRAAALDEPLLGAGASDAATRGGVGSVVGGETTAGDGADGAGDGTPRFVHRRTTYVNDWSEHRHFWGLAFPCLFMPSDERLPDGTPDLERRDYPAGFTREGGTRRARKLTMADWTCYLVSCDDMRYARDPKLRFVLQNLKAREMARRKVSFAHHSDSKQGIATPTMDDMRAQFEAALVMGEGAGDDTAGAGLPSGASAQPPGAAALPSGAAVASPMVFSAGERKASATRLQKLAVSVACSCDGLTGSPPYWWGKRKEVEALVHARLEESDTLPVAFVSCSMAEYHWPEVGRLLHEVLVDVGDCERAAKIKPMQSGGKPDKNALGQLVREYTGVLNELFAARAEAFVQIVLRQGLGFSDFWYRIEFSKLRAQAHLHGLFWHDDLVRSIGGSLEGAGCAENLDDAKRFERTAAAKVEQALRDAGFNYTATHAAGRQREGAGRETPWVVTRAKVNAELKSAAHDDVPAAMPHANVKQQRRFVAGKDVHADDMGNFQCWPAPEGPPVGVYAKPSYEPLKRCAHEVQTAGEELWNAIHFDNRVNLHQCGRSYCLHNTGKTRKNGDDTVVCLECRFGFGVEGATGKPARARADLVTDERGVTRLEPERDHPRLNARDEWLASTWGANMDVQFILAPDMDVSVLFDRLAGSTPSAAAGADAAGAVDHVRRRRGGGARARHVLGEAPRGLVAGSSDDEDDGGDGNRVSHPTIPDGHVRRRRGGGARARHVLGEAPRRLVSSSSDDEGDGGDGDGYHDVDCLVAKLSLYADALAKEGVREAVDDLAELQAKRPYRTRGCAGFCTHAHARVCTCLRAPPRLPSLASPCRPRVRDVRRRAP